MRFLQRRDSTTHVVGAKRRTEVCGGDDVKRNLRDVGELKGVIFRAARAAGVAVVFETVYIENANPGGFCDQLRRFAESDVLVSVHGAHLVNAPWLAPRGLLLEALPFASVWSMFYPVIVVAAMAWRPRISPTMTPST